MKRRVFGAKLMSTASVAALYLLVGGVGVAAEQKVEPSVGTASGAAASGRPAVRGSHNGNNAQQYGPRGSYGYGRPMRGQGAGNGATRGSQNGYYGPRGPAGYGPGQGVYPGAAPRAAQGNSQGQYRQGFGGNRYNPYRAPQRNAAPVAPAISAPKAPVVIAPAPVAIPKMVKPKGAPTGREAVAATAGKANTDQGKNQPSAQQQTGRRWMPGWLKWPGRVGKNAPAGQPQAAHKGARAPAPAANTAPAAAPQRQVRRQAPPQGWKPSAGARPTMRRDPRMQGRPTPPWIRGNQYQRPQQRGPMMQQQQRGPGVYGNRGPQYGGQMQRPPMQAMPHPSAPANQPGWRFKKPQMPAWMKNRQMPEWAKKRPQMPAWMKNRQMPEWAKKRPQMPEWMKNRQMPEWAKKRPQMPGWMKNRQMSEWAKKRPHMPEWMKNRQMPEWAKKRPHMPEWMKNRQMPEWAKNRPQMPEWMKNRQMPEWAKTPKIPEWAKPPKMPEWVKKNLGLSKGKNAKAGQAVSKPAAGAANAVKGAQPSTTNMPSPPPWMGQGTAKGKPAAPALPVVSGKTAGSAGEAGSANKAKTTATDSQKSGSSDKNVPGKQSKSTKSAPWWSGVVTSGGNGK